MTVRVLVGNDAIVRSPLFAGADGEAADCTSTPTCAVTREDGTVLAAATVSNVAGQLGAYSALLTATTHDTRLDWLTLTWTGIVTGVGTVVLTQTVEVVGRFYLDTPSMRLLPGLSDAVKFPASVLRDACNTFEDLAERYTGRAWVPRYAVDRFPGDGGTKRLLREQLPRTPIISAAAVDLAGASTAYTVTNWTIDPTGVLHTDGATFNTATYGQNNIVVRYPHGADTPPPQLASAAGAYVVWKVLRDRSQVGRDVLSTIDASGLNIRYSTPDWDAGRPTGLLDVDNILNALGARALAIA